MSIAFPLALTVSPAFAVSGSTAVTLCAWSEASRAMRGSNRMESPPFDTEGNCIPFRGWMQGVSPREGIDRIKRTSESNYGYEHHTQENTDLAAGRGPGHPRDGAGGRGADPRQEAQPDDAGGFRHSTLAGVLSR